MATNPNIIPKAVELTQAQLTTIAGGGSVTKDGNTYTADAGTLYLTEDTSVLFEAQNLTNEQKAQARTNIGAGTGNSDFSGSYNDLTDKPTIPTTTDSVTSGSTAALTSGGAYTALSGKQATLVSGTNIKTINNESILGSGNITISGGESSTDVQINGTSIVSNNVANIITNSPITQYNKIATMMDIQRTCSIYSRLYIIDATRSGGMECRNTSFNSSSSTITISWASSRDEDTYVETIDNNTMWLNEDFNLGDIVYPTQTNLPIRYVSEINETNETVTFTILNTKLAVNTIETYAIAGSNWTSLSNSSPYTYQATVTATETIGNDTIVELINDQPVLFATYGFAIGSVSGQNITIYSIGQPSSSVTLKVKIGG